MFSSSLKLKSRATITEPINNPENIFKYVRDKAVKICAAGSNLRIDFDFDKGANPLSQI